MAKLRIKPHAAEYRVLWNQARGRFDVYREKERIPSFSRQQGPAVGLAIREAKREALLNGHKIIVTSIRNGKRTIEWDGEIPD